MPRYILIYSTVQPVKIDTLFFLRMSPTCFQETPFATENKSIQPIIYRTFSDNFPAGQSVGAFPKNSQLTVTYLLSYLITGIWSLSKSPWAFLIVCKFSLKNHTIILKSLVDLIQLWRCFLKRTDSSVIELS